MDHLGTVGRAVSEVHEEGPHLGGACFGEDLASNRDPVIEPCVREYLIQRYGGTGLGIETPKDSPGDSSIDQRACAHWTWLLGDIQRAFYSPRAQLRCRRAERYDLGMRRGILIDFSPIMARSDQLVAYHHDRSDWDISGGSGELGLGQRVLHPMDVFVGTVMSFRLHGRIREGSNL
jgi:hypothetical protein